ncbi:hypothetical protein GW575_00120 [Campylobacter sp. MIT 19-121]|uniref:hypothetical protein n=1 Tax=Campylobacter sp. MIT 19-121 TaxID=2703906 RepID=UPI001389970A|nr:hypothetical protein [Campylobacter sp. MIT 19-121]NDJ26362.1 hypothetical protein [Campylobacter sp. MIT 19-121]
MLLNEHIQAFLATSNELKIELERQKEQSSSQKIDERITQSLSLHLPAFLSELEKQVQNKLKEELKTAKSELKGEFEADFDPSSFINAYISQHNNALKKLAKSLAVEFLEQNKEGFKATLSQSFLSQNEAEFKSELSQNLSRAKAEFLRTLQSKLKSLESLKDEALSELVKERGDELVKNADLSFFRYELFRNAAFQSTLDKLIKEAISSSLSQKDFKKELKEAMRAFFEDFLKGFENEYKHKLLSIRFENALQTTSIFVQNEMKLIAFKMAEFIELEKGFETQSLPKKQIFKVV